MYLKEKLKNFEKELAKDRKLELYSLRI